MQYLISNVGSAREWDGNAQIVWWFCASAHVKREHRMSLWSSCQYACALQAVTSGGQGLSSHGRRAVAETKFSKFLLNQMLLDVIAPVSRGSWTGCCKAYFAIASQNSFKRKIGLLKRKPNTTFIRQQQEWHSVLFAWFLTINQTCSCKSALPVGR